MEILSQYWFEFATIATLHFFAVASPGPDFAVVLRHSISYGRQAAVFTSIGIGAGILVHVTYSLLGIGLLIKTTPWLFQVFLYASAMYLIYLGYGALRSQPQNVATPTDIENNHANVAIDKAMGNGKAFSIGFITNGLNPKATLFFLTVFAVFVSTDTSNTVRAIYGVYLACATGAWFCFLSYILSTQRIRNLLYNHAYMFDRAMGVILIGFAIHLVVSSVLEAG